MIKENKPVKKVKRLLKRLGCPSLAGKKHIFFQRNWNFAPANKVINNHKNRSKENKAASLQ